MSRPPADGKTVAFTRTVAGRTSVWTLPVAGGTAAAVPDTAVDSQPAWSPSGRMLTVIRVGESVVLTNLEGTFRRTSRTGGGGSYHHPSPSPTAARISYLATYAATSYLLTCYTDGGGCLGPPAEQYYPRNARWAPDGTRVVFEGTYAGQTSLYTVDWFAGKVVGIPNSGSARRTLS